MKKYDFVREQINQVRDEIKKRKKWVKELYKELEKVHSNKDATIRAINIGNKMLEHYRKIQTELITMLTDLIEIEGE